MIGDKPFKTGLLAVIGLGLAAAGWLSLPGAGPAGQAPDGLAAQPAGPAADVQEAPAAPDLPLQANVVEQPFPRNSSLHQVLRQAGMDAASIHRLIEEVRPVYNLARVKAGHRLLIEGLAEGGLDRLEYDIDNDGFLVVERDSQGYRARRQAFEYQLEEVLVEGEISSSLWDSLISQGEGDGLVMALSNVFQWDVDFTSVQPGDSYSVLVEKKYREGEFVQYGDIRAARFASSGKAFYAFLYQLPESGKKVYYDHRGEAVRKAFLKVPFHFSPSITSGYSYSRFHPIHKVRRPHLGVDYGAPAGTPVLASASGRVVFAGWNGGFGKQVRIRHPNGFTTSYAHLSRINVRAGQSIGQSQQVGRVGATGTATGAHLDYRVQNASGRYLNPRQMISWPSDKPVERRYWKDFLAVRDTFLRRLDPSLAWGCELDRSTLAALTD